MFYLLYRVPRIQMSKLSYILPCLRNDFPREVTSTLPLPPAWECTISTRSVSHPLVWERTISMREGRMGIASRRSCVPLNRGGGERWSGSRFAWKSCTPKQEGDGVGISSRGSCASLSRNKMLFFQTF